MKKLISALLVILMMLQIGTFAAEEKIYLESGTEDLVERLRILGVFDKFDDERIFYDNSAIKRREAAIALCTMLGEDVSGSSESAELKFFDVPAYSDYINAVNYVTGLGIMSGDANGMFRPDEEMKIGHVLKCMIVALGYGWKAEAYGGYPNGYLRVASELKFITKKHIDEAATRVDFLNLLNEAIEKPICATIGISGENIDFEIDEDVTILTEYHSIYIDEGVVQNNRITSLRQSADGYENVVFIGNRRLHVNAALDVYSLLGYEVEYYYRYDKDADECYLLLVEPTEKNEILHILKKDFNSYSGNLISYHNEKGKRNEMKIASSVVVVNNGEVSTNISSAINGYEGTLTAIDNNNDKLFDVIIVKNYTYDKVKSVVSKEGKLYAENKILNLENYESVTITDAQTGDALTLADIETGEIIGYAESSDKEKLMVDVLGMGTAINITAMDATSFFTDAGQEFDASILSAKQKTLIKPGATVSVVLMENYYAVWADVASEAVNIGYLIVLGERDRIGKAVIDGIKLLATDGTVKIYETAEQETIVLNGKKIKSTLLKGMLTDIKTANNLAGDGAISQVISYKLNDEGKMTHIYTVDNSDDSKLYTKFKYNERGKIEIYNKKSYGAKYGTVGTKNYNLNYHIGASTPCFRVSLNGQEGLDDDYFACSTYSAMGADYKDDGKEYMLDSYIADERDITPVAVVYFSEQAELTAVTDEGMTLASTGNFVLVKDTYFARDEDGEFRFVIEGIRNGGAVKFYFDDTASSQVSDILTNTSDKNGYNPEEKQGFTIGDLACVALDNDGFVRKIHKVFDRETKTLNDFYKLDNNGNDVTGDKKAVVEIWSAYNLSKDGNILEAYEADLTQGIPDYDKLKLYYVEQSLSNDCVAFYDDAQEKVYVGTGSDIIDYHQDPERYSILLVRRSNGGWIVDEDIQIIYNYNN